MIEQVQADWMMNEDEHDEHRTFALTHPTFNETGYIVAYRMGKTNKAMILLTDDIIDTQHAITHKWLDTGLTAEVYVFGKGDTYKLNAIYEVLKEHRASSKVRCQGWDRVFVWQSWFKYLIEEKGE